jgi:hypothetical protein
MFFIKINPDVADQDFGWFYASHIVRFHRVRAMSSPQLFNPGRISSKMFKTNHEKHSNCSLI